MTTGTMSSGNAGEYACDPKKSSSALICRARAPQLVVERTFLSRPQHTGHTAHRPSTRPAAGY
jgi:hypothetical protein